MTCPCCGSARTRVQPVLWKELIGQWRLAAHEAAYVDRQQGLRCADCGCNLRSMALARAITACFRFTGLLAKFVRGAAARRVRVLEINEAAG